MAADHTRHPSRRVAYMLQQPLKERLQGQQIIVPLYIDKTSEWCNSFILVPGKTGKTVHGSD